MKKLITFLLVILSLQGISQTVNTGIEQEKKQVTDIVVPGYTNNNRFQKFLKKSGFRVDEQGNKQTKPISTPQNIKQKSTYDSNGNLILRVEYKWDTTTNQWVNYSKTEYTYDSKGNKILGVIYHWDTNTNQWKIFNKIEFTYDSNGNKTLEVGYHWDTKTNQWVN